MMERITDGPVNRADMEWSGEFHTESVSNKHCVYEDKRDGSDIAKITHTCAHVWVLADILARIVPAICFILCDDFRPWSLYLVQCVEFVLVAQLTYNCVVSSGIEGGAAICLSI